MRTISMESKQGTVSLLGIPGTACTDSLNVELLGNAAREAPADVSLRLYLEPGLWRLPPFDPAPAGGDVADVEVERLRQAVADCDGIVVATPEYNGSLPGGLKNAIDWIAAREPSQPGSRAEPLSGKPAVVIGADRGSFGCDWAVADARKVLEVAGARVLAETLAIPRADQVFDERGELCEEVYRAKLGALMELLAREARAGRSL